jgi:Gram-negative bacterial TonB protein C-terminal
MDAPGGQVMEIHPPSRYHSSFFNLPGERVLESPSMTIHIQRSVRTPPAHAWWPFNRNKKVVVGELVSRVDPQVAAVPASSNDSVRVSAVVAQDGRIETVRPMNGPATLVPAVVKAVHEWRYQPTLIDDKPVETECYIVVQFHAPANRTARQ